MRSSLAIALLAPGLAVALYSCSSDSRSSAKVTEPPKPTQKPGLTMFFTAEVQGSTEPCGCTSDPLGDLARTSQIIAEARALGPVLVMDGGSTLYSQVEIAENILAQEKLKSNLIETTYRTQLQVSAYGLGPHDLGEGPGRVRPARHAVNLVGDSGITLEAPKVIDAGDIKVGVFGIVSPIVMKAVGLQASSTAPAAKKAIAELKSQGAQVIVVLAQMDDAEARAMAKATPGMDFVLISNNLPEPKDVRSAAIKVGDTWLFAPANRGQVLSRLRLTRRGTGVFVDAVGEVRAGTDIERIDQELESLQKKLAEWQADPNADQGFLANKKREQEELAARKALLTASGLQAPEQGNYFTLAQLPINRRLDCQPAVVLAKQDYDKKSGQANVAAAPPRALPPVEGQATYVGIEECAMCHQEAVEFWKDTRHGKAWHTLEVADKQFNYDCIGCHVTGFDKPGGSTMGFNEALRDVQCEQCHGPGSLHVDAEGSKELVATIVRTPEERVCLKCHTEEHSDTFAFEAYLRDVTGKGHGPALRASLGSGETGASLRASAVKNAGAGIGKNCPK